MIKVPLTIPQIWEYWRRSRWLKSCLVLLLVLCLAPIGITQAVRLGQYLKFLQTRKLPGPTWRGLTVGQSTFDEVTVAMGEPLETWTRGDETYYAYRDADQEDYAQHQIVMRDGVVEWMMEDMLGHRPIREKVMLTEFVDCYGKPDSVQWSTSGEGDRVVIFLDDGVFVIVSSLTNFDDVYILNVFYYRPRPLPQVLRDFSAYITEFGVTGYCTDLDCVDWGPKDPWYGGDASPWPDWAPDWLFP